MALNPALHELMGAKTTRHNLNRLIIEGTQSVRFAYAKSASPALASVPLKFLSPLTYVSAEINNIWGSDYNDLRDKYIPWTPSLSQRRKWAAISATPGTPTLHTDTPNPIDAFLLQDPDQDGWARAVDSTTDYEVMGLVLVAGVVHIEDIANYNPHLESVGGATGVITRDSVANTFWIQALVQDCVNGFLNPNIRVEGISATR